MIFAVIDADIGTGENDMFSCCTRRAKLHTRLWRCGSLSYDGAGIQWKQEEKKTQYFITTNLPYRLFKCAQAPVPRQPGKCVPRNPIALNQKLEIRLQTRRQ